jgi:hypothetical protein
LGFNFRIEYKPDAMNIVADSLSRRDTKSLVLAYVLSVPSFQLFNELHTELALDPAMVALR